MNREYFKLRSFLLKKPKFEHRKKVHYFLLATVILLQVIVVVIWYHETKNDTKNTLFLKNIDTSARITKLTNKINNTYLISQQYFNHYLDNKDVASIKNYSVSLQEISSLIDSVRWVTHNNSDFNKILREKNSVESDILVLKSSIDSIITLQIYPNQQNILNLFKFKEFEFEKVLNSVKTESKVKVDSVSKKGLLLRLGDALAGRADVQKEQINTTVTFQYKDKVTSGSIKDQIEKIFITTNSYYKNEFNNLKKSFFALDNKKASRIKFEMTKEQSSMLEGKFNDELYWNDLTDWYVDAMNRFYDAVNPYLDKI